MEEPSLSIVIPSHHNATTICRELEELDALLRTLVATYEIILVIDGNDDNTLSVVMHTLRLPTLRIECFSRNRGKGFALRHGFALARGRLVAFIDAGGDLDVRELNRFLAAQTLYEADIIIGSKRHSLSEVSYPFLRRLYSRVYQLLNRALFRLRVRDTQVGMKLFRKEVLDAVLPRLLVKAFAFDLELLVVANHLGYRRIVEAPVHLHHGFSSSVNWRAVARTLWDTLAVFYRLRILHWYDQPRSLGPLLSTADTVSVPASAFPRPASAAQALQPVVTREGAIERGVPREH